MSISIMMKVLKRVQSVLGTKRPTVAVFDIFMLAFGYWNELPAYFREFLVRLFVHDRECLLHFLLEETPLKELRYPLLKPDLVLKLMFILEKNKKTGRISYLHLAFALLVSFRYPYTLRTLAEYLRKQQPVAGDLLQLAGKIQITGDFD